MRISMNFLSAGSAIAVAAAMMAAPASAKSEASPAKNTAPAASAAAADAAAPAASGQDQPSPQDASSSDPSDIVVTATKTSTLASKTPIALSVFSGAQLKDQGVNSVADLKNIAPSLEVGSAAHGVNISIRGVATTDITSKGEQGVSFNVDTVPIGRPQIMGLSFFDIERVEVLRGPQGTLYGKSSTGGAINVITARPKDTFDASASVEFGNFNDRRAEAMVNVPIASGFAIRAAGSYNMRDGWLYPVLGNTQTVNTQPKLNDVNNWTGRLSAMWDINSTSDFRLTGTFGHIGGTGDTNAALFDRVNRFTGREARKVFYNPFAGFMDDDFHLYNAELNVGLGAVRFTYDGAHLWFRGNDNYDPSTYNPAGGAGAPAYGWRQYFDVVKTDSHEIRLSNSKPSRLEWVLGANYWFESINERDLNWQTLAGCTPQLSAACNNPNPHIVGITKHRAKGVFGQFNYEITDGLKITLGGRYSTDSSSRRATIAAGGPPPGGWVDSSGRPCAPPNACVGTTPDNGDQSASKFTWRIGADYQFGSNQLLYASVATGYKAGSFNDIDPTSPTHAAGPYGPESLVAYEVGYKGEIVPHLRVSTALYYYDYKKYQLTGATFLTPNFTGGAPLVLIYTTLPPAELKGWETELTWTPTPNDTVGFSTTVSEGHFTGGPNHARVGFIYSNQIDWTGKRLDNLPKFTARFNYEHKFQLAGGGYFSARVNSKYSSGYFESNLGGDGNPFSGVYTVLPSQYKQKSFTRSDFNLGYTSASNKFSIDLFVRNIENKLQYLSAPQNAGTGTADYTAIRVSEPRTFGARLSLRY